MVNVVPRSISRALTIAGSDSGGGAGIEADVKTFSALGVHGSVAITAVTAQNTVGVSTVHEIPPDVIKAQVEAVVRDIGVDCTKTGMLYSSTTIKEVSSLVGACRLKLVVDPVMVAKSGAALLKADAHESLVTTLIPLAEVVTPNIDEAEALTGMRISSVDDSAVAAWRIVDMGAKAVVVKGGHLKGRPVDVLCLKGGKPMEFSGERILSGTTHGTGCTFSAALTAYLAKGIALGEAVRKAKEFVASAISFGLPIGKGVGPVEPMSMLRVEAERWKVFLNMVDAISLLESADGLAKLSPECQVNIAMSLPPPYAVDPDSVCGIPGRFRAVGGRLHAAFCPAFGASRHVAGALLTAMKHDERIRASMNIRCSKEILTAAKKLGYVIGNYDRKREPPDVKAAEGASIPWGIAQAISGAGQVPDIIYHKGDIGKEPMINIFGRDAVEVAVKAIRLSKIL
jgi:hydroxymethylpyrimidine kinase/phosphomethylpyrimidine kinase